MLDWCPRGRWFDYEPEHCQVTTLGKLFTHMPLFTKQYNLVPAKGRWSSEAGKIIVGQASHWPCVTDGGLSTYELNGHRKGDEHPAYAMHYLYSSAVILIRLRAWQETWLNQSPSNFQTINDICRVSWRGQSGWD